MRGIMQARQKPLEVLASQNATATSQIDTFEKPAPKSAVQLIVENDLDTLIELLHKEAKVI
jgi:electron transfer flavoprotein beta subunit